jgi:hypothetical protein
MFNATGGHHPYTFTVSSGTLPTGLTLSTSGALTGTLSAEGTFTFTILATDSNGCTGKRLYTVEADCPDIMVKPPHLPDATIGHPYSKTFMGQGGTGPYTFTVESGSLPPGLTLTPGGLLSGTPTTEGSFSFTILATDVYGCTGKRNYTIGVKCSTITVNPEHLPNGAVNHPYNRTITAAGAVGSVTFTVENGELPDGLTLSTGGVLSGTPTTEGSFYFTILATDAFGCTGERPYFVYVKGCPSITVKPSNLSNGTVGQSYNKSISAMGGDGPYTFTVESGTLPTGLTLSTGGALSGTFTASGDFTFAILATDSFGCTGKRLYSISVSCPDINVSPSNLPNGTVNHPYNRTITANGGNSPYSFTVLSGNLPNGLTLTQAGVLSGTPTTAGSFTFTILAQDRYGCSGKRNYNLTISGH